MSNFINFFLKFFLVIFLAIIVTLIQFNIKGASFDLFSISKSNLLHVFIYNLLFLQNVLLVALILWIASFNTWIFRIVFYLLFFITFAFIYSVKYYHIVFDKSILGVVAANYKLFQVFITFKSVLVVTLGIAMAVVIDIVIIRTSNKLLKLKYFSKSGVSFFIIGIIVLSVGITCFNQIINIKSKDIKRSIVAPSVFNMFFPYVAVNNILYTAKKAEAVVFSDPKYKARINYLEEATKSKNYKITNYNKKPKTVIFIFGESLDASHLSANGYSRNTTTLLAKEKNIVFIKNTVSCATYTAKAHACISKPITTKDVNDEKNEFIDYVLNNKNIYSFAKIIGDLGFTTYYIRRYNAEYPIKIIQDEYQNSLQLGENNIFKEEKLFKDNFLKVLNSTNNNKFITVYLRGSHVNYANGFTKNTQKFNPITNNGSITAINSTKEIPKVINTYDNTIVYTDYIMHWLISKLKQSDQNSIVFFFSDHGDNINKLGQAMHGMAYKDAPKDVINPGAFVWVSDAWLKNIDNTVLTKVKQYKNKTFSYDNIYPSVLHCIGITSKYIDAKKSICY